MVGKQEACLMGAIIGAAVGAAVAYLYATDEGAHQRVRISRAVDRMTLDAEEAQRLWRRLNDAWTEFERNRPRPERAGVRSWPPEGVA